MNTPHGADSKYQGGCRCDECRAAHAQANRNRRKRKQVRSHGTQSGYSNGCRCDLCRDAHRQYQNALNARTREMRNWTAS